MAFIGLGRMGSRMATRLLEAGVRLRVHSRTKGKADPLIAQGAVWAPTPKAAAEGAATVIAMLPTPEASAAVILGRDGVLAARPLPRLVVEMSTIDPALARRHSDTCEAAGVGYLDAPVSGSTGAAESGSLIVLVGGKALQVEQATELLSLLSKRIVTLGAVGTGSAMKLALNALLAIYNEGLSESLGLCEGFGIDLELAWEVIAATALGAPYMEYKREVFLGGTQSEVAFTIDLMRKDADLAADLAAQREIAVPALMASIAELRQAIASGRGDEDVGSVRPLS